MYYQLYLHRPRTQRIGVNATPRDIFIMEFDSIEKANNLKARFLHAHDKQISAGYPWPHGKIRFGNKHCQLQPNDRFFIKVTESPTKKKYTPPYEETTEELVDSALDMMRRAGW